MTRNRRRSSSRGQGLVEFALILPLLVLLMVMALDFGRVFFGWVALQNATRVAADYAAKNYTAWTTPDEGIKELERDRYEELIEEDAAAINCDMAAVPAPTFTDAGTGAADTTPETGDHATVKLECQMALLTPLAGSFFGGGVPMSAEADFAVHKPETIKLPEEEVPAPPPGCDTGEARVPSLVGKTMDAAITAWDVDFDRTKYSPALVTSGPGNNKNKIVATQTPMANDCANTTDQTMVVTLP